MFELNQFNPYSVLEIDSVAITPRHLIRMPYSINEKKGRVSLPISPEMIEDFEPDMAKPENIKEYKPFIDRSKAVSGEANELFIQAFDFFKKSAMDDKPDEAVKKMNFAKSFEKIPPEKYPPCIKSLLDGLIDGKKRALFILVNYFKSANYSREEINEIIKEWNKKTRSH